MNAATGDPAITTETPLPDVLRNYPQLRAVFDRYGLRGCGGELGPAESIRYFAGAHGVDAEQLVMELRAAIADPSRLPAAASADAALDTLADTIYRRFFKAGIVVVLTAGAVWGAVLLLRIGVNRAFTAISIHDINAHGHAQIFGWVGLFVMGFAYQAFPRMKHTNLWRPDLANLSFYLMLFGIFARALGEPLFEAPALRALALAGGTAEIVAIVLFIVVIARTLQHSGKPLERYDAYALAALALFFIQAVYELALLCATTGAASRAELLGLIATYQAPLRDVQIHGFALLMILGVALRMFPPLFGLAEPRAGLVRWCWSVLLVAIIGEVVFFLLMRKTGQHGWAGPLYLAWLLLAAASIALTFKWSALARPTETDRSIKFVRAAVGWLHLSMLLLVAAPAYQFALLPNMGLSLSETGRQALAINFSHAYYGAVRHAITVGFISLMILGMAAKVVPTLNGVDIRRLRPLWLPFALVNLGCLLRVSLQIATDLTTVAFSLVGVSGVLEVTGITLWGVHLWRIMNGWRPAEPVASGGITRISADDKVGLIVERFPQTLPIFLEFGFAPLRNPVLRRTMARVTSVRSAAAMQEIDLDALLTELNRAAFGTDRPV